MCFLLYSKMFESHCFIVCSVQYWQPVGACGYSAPEMWLARRDMCCQCKIHMEFQTKLKKKKMTEAWPQYLLFNKSQ